MNFATYLPVTQDIIKLYESGRTIRAANEYRELDHRLNDETRIVPHTRTAYDIVSAAVAGITAPVVISEGSYKTQAERDAILEERHRVWGEGCELAGHDGADRRTDRCDFCEERRIGTLHYAPDGLGRPTPVVFTCDECSKETV